MTDFVRDDLDDYKDEGVVIGPGSYLFHRLCGLIVSVSKIYGSTDSH